jgi:hypothetical protein
MVQSAPEAAQQPSKDLELVVVIQAGNTYIKAYYSTEHGKLRETIEQQTQIVDAVWKRWCRVQVQSLEICCEMQVQSLKKAVQSAREAAQQPSKDLELVNMIQAGNTDINTYYRKEHEKLREIIEQQTQIVDAVWKQSISTATLSSMAEGMLETLEQAAQSSDNVVKALRKVAAQQSLTLAEMLDIWKITRRQNNVQRKRVVLANTPCSGRVDSSTLKTIDEHTFSINASATQLSTGMEVSLFSVRDQHCVCSDSHSE